MSTCAFCGTELDNTYCSYCEMELESRYILKNGKRLEQSKRFKGYPSRSLIFESTKILMGLETIELLCLLREARAFRSEMYQLRLLRHKAEEQEGYTEDINELEEKTYDEYANATRKVWVIENIIKDRLGYYPHKVTMNYLNMYLKRMQKSENKAMKMEGKKDNEKKLSRTSR